MDIIYYVFLLLIIIIVYLGFASFLGKRIKKSVQSQTVSANPFALPSVSETKYRERRRRCIYLNMSEQRKRRKLFRQSKYLYNKHGIR